jgi:hypothetical protein
MEIDQLKMCAHLSRLAYKRPGDKLDKDDFYTAVDDKFPMFIDGNPQSDAQAYAWLLEDTKNKSSTPKQYMFICFRGTESKRDMLANIDIRHEKIKDNICVHSGFMGQFKSVEEEICKILDQHESEYSTIVCCGHSLGGALAMIAAPILAERYKTKELRCYTYGAPRVGNGDFCKWFKGLVKINCRVVNERDPVTMIPLSFLYVHVDDGICFKDDNTHVIIKRDLPWYLRLITYWKKLNLSELIKEHDARLYIERLMRLEKV